MSEGTPSSPNPKPDANAAKARRPEPKHEPEIQLAPADPFPEFDFDAPSASKPKPVAVAPDIAKTPASTPANPARTPSSPPPPKSTTEPVAPKAAPPPKSAPEPEPESQEDPAPFELDLPMYGEPPKSKPSGPWGSNKPSEGGLGDLFDTASDMSALTPSNSASKALVPIAAGVVLILIAVASLGFFFIRSGGDSEKVPSRLDAQSSGNDKKESTDQTPPPPQVAVVVPPPAPVLPPPPKPEIQPPAQTPAPPAPAPEPAPVAPRQPDPTPVAVTDADDDIPELSILEAGPDDTSDEGNISRAQALFLKQLKPLLKDYRAKAQAFHDIGGMNLKDLPSSAIEQRLTAIADMKSAYEPYNKFLILMPNFMRLELAKSNVSVIKTNKAIADVTQLLESTKYAPSKSPDLATLNRVSIILNQLKKLPAGWKMADDGVTISDKSGKLMDQLNEYLANTRKRMDNSGVLRIAE